MARHTLREDREDIAAVSDLVAEPTSTYFVQVRALFIALVALAVFFSIPFFSSANSSWAEMNPYLQGMTLSLAAALICHACLSFRVGNTLLLLAASLCISLAAESLGMRWTWPFSSQYHYNAAIGPTLPGDVPLCIPVTWFMLAYTAVIFLGPFSVRPRGSLSFWRVILKTSWCALFIMAADLAIDPLAVKHGAWTWHQPGGYFGVPWGNYLGWFIVGFLICGSTILLEKPRPGDRDRDYSVLDRPFVISSISLTMICFVESAIRVGSFRPAVLAFSFMAPCWIYWLFSANRSRQSSSLN